MAGTESWLTAAGLLIIGAAIGIAMVALWSFVVGERRASLRRRRPLIGAALVLGILVVAGLVARDADPRLTQAAVGSITARLLSVLPDVAIAGLVVIVGYVGGSVLRQRLDRLVHRIRPRLVPAVGIVAHGAVVAIAALVAAGQMGIAVGAIERVLLVMLGGLVLAAAIGAGLGSRELIGALLVGRYVARLVDVGDEVEVDGIRGEVLDLGATTVRLGLGEVQAEIPNARLLDTVVLVHRRARRAGSVPTDQVAEAPHAPPARTP